MRGWITPIIRGIYDEVGNVIRTEIVDPPELNGMQTFIMQAQQCLRRMDGDRGDIACGLVRNHDGPCWVCTTELLDRLDGAIAIGGPLRYAGAVRPPGFRVAATPCPTCKGDDQLHTYTCPDCKGTGVAT